MKIICIGRNYTEHARELNNEVPSEPVFFLKPDSALLLNNQPFFIPDFSADVQFEVELLIRINRLGKHIAERFAHRYYQEMGLGIDFTARDIQKRCKEKGLPWEVAKAFDRSAVVSNFVPLREGEISFSLYKNGELVQQGNSKQMIFPVEKLVSHVSTYMTLKIGDIFFTGTPPGVGPVSKGDRLEGFIEGEKMLDFMVR